MHEYLYHIMDIQKHNPKFGGFIETISSECGVG